MWLLNHVVNPVVGLLLCSPFHRLLSGRLVLLRITGRRSGRAFDIPVAYARDGDSLLITVGAPERKRWWRNISAATPVDVVLQGRRRSGVARREVAGVTTVRVTLTEP